MDVRAAAYIDRIASFEDEATLRAQKAEGPRRASPPPEIEAEFEEAPLPCFTTGFLAHILGQVLMANPTPAPAIAATRAYPARRKLRPGISFDLTA